MDKLPAPFDKFDKIGEYRKPNEAPEYLEYIGRTKSKERSVIYLLTVDEKVLYIGETRRGFSRPLWYHENDVMKVQREGIYEKTKRGKIVEVFALEIANIEVTCPITGDLIDAYIGGDVERHLIAMHKPAWNGRS